MHLEWRRAMRKRLIAALTRSSNSEAWKAEVERRWREWEFSQEFDWDWQGYAA